MAITVVCPGCHKRFNVGDQFAGKSGPCPKCKTVIKIPAKSDEVQVHESDEFAGSGRGQDGKLVLKPIEREETPLTPLRVGLFAGSFLLTILVAILGRSVFASSWIAVALGTFLVSPPLAWAAYGILRDQESEPFRGREVMLRALICGAVYALLWASFGYTSGYVIADQMYSWIIAAVPFIAIGGLVSLATFDLDFPNGCLHYAFYLVVTILLRWLAGMGWIWNIVIE
jgi:hypothetical protein